MELKELTETIEKMHKTVNVLHETIGDRAKAEAKGVVDSMITEKMAKVNEAISNLETVKKNIETMLAAKNRPIILDAKGNQLPEDHAEVTGAYGKFLRKGTTTDGGYEQKQFHWDKKTMSVISDSDGGFTVTADLSGRMVQKIFETSPVRQVAAQQTIGTDALEGLMDLNENGAGWVNETGARAATSTPQLNKWRIQVFEMYASLAATQQLLDDSNVDVEGYLAMKAADKFARLENTAFINGDGVTRPRGMLTYANGTTLPGTVEQVLSGVAGTLNYASMVNLEGALKTPYRNNASWAFNRAGIAVLRGLLDGYGHPLWEPSVQAGRPAKFMGYNINEFNDLPALASSALFGVFANFSEFYQIVDRVGMRVLRDPYTNKPFVIFYSTKRTGGGVLNFEAGKILKIT